MEVFLALKRLNSYVEYLIDVDHMGSSAREEMIRAQFGAKPFGQGLTNWLEHSAGFQTDRICTPSLFQINTPVTLARHFQCGSFSEAQSLSLNTAATAQGDSIIRLPAWPTPGTTSRRVAISRWIS